MNPKIIEACNWEDIQREYANLKVLNQDTISIDNRMIIANRWLFRGQKDSTWAIQSSYQRLLNRREGTPLSQHDKMKLERLMLNSYKSQAHAYLTTNEIPESTQLEEWLALMQHHGTATRLVDWTYNFFIAVLFAIEDLDFSAKESPICSVWCIRAAPFIKYTLENLLKKKVSEKYISTMQEKEPGRFNEFLSIEDDSSAILQMTPSRFNHRLAAQQGTFLLQADISKPMCQDICEIQRIAKENPLNDELAKDINSAFQKIDIQLTKEKHIRIMRELQEMNITRQTLFPDLEGYSKSINTFGLWLDPKIDVSPR